MATSRGAQAVSRRAVTGNTSTGRIIPSSGTAVRSSNMFGNGPGQGDFFVSSYTLNVITDESGTSGVKFPGNIQPEGYFYSPFYEVQLKEIEDELQSLRVVRINFVPEESIVVHKTDMPFYNPDIGCSVPGNLYDIRINTPVPYNNLLIGQPFCIYDVLKEETYRGYLNEQDGRTLSVYTETEIEQSGLDGTDGEGKSRYIISYLPENAPEYAEYIPAEEKLVWRGAKKMSELDADSPLYNLPFTNGRTYIQKNINVFVRRQDPFNDNSLFKPTEKNPLKRYQIEGDKRIDFDLIKYITDSMIDAC